MQAKKDNNDSTTPAVTTTAHGNSNSSGNIAQDVSSSQALPSQLEQPIQMDIEHVLVQDDPRQWSSKRRSFTLVIVATAALIATLGVNIYNPAIDDIKAQLHVTDQDISTTLSVFILVQGATPLFWSAVSEIRGRKLVYLLSISLYLIGCGVAGSAKSVSVLISMRVVQAIGGSAVLTIGAATLADIYEPWERGTVVGIYYAAPLLGPAFGPLIGGVATQLFSWRATFFFLVIFAGLSLVSFVFFKDTFRRERSLSYQSALRRARRDRDDKIRGKEEIACPRGSKDNERNQAAGVIPSDLEALPKHLHSTLADIQPNLLDINPFPPLYAVLKRHNNIVILIPSGMLFGLAYCITYTAVRTLAAGPYFYKSFDIGLVLLSFGIGSMGGSILGGRWSDHVLKKLKISNGGKTACEDRLQSTKPTMLLLPPSLLAYAWLTEKKIHIAGVCVALFLVGFSSIWIYSSTLAYLVDANAGRSSTAVATNSFFRGTAAFIAAEVAVPLQDKLGDGWLYTIWAGLMLVMSTLILLTITKGAHWRELAEEREMMCGEIS